MKYRLLVVIFWAALFMTAPASAHHGKPTSYICFAIENMLTDFVRQHPGYRVVAHLTNDEGQLFMAWYNSNPPVTRWVADEIIVHGRPDTVLYIVWFVHDSCWQRVFKMTKANYTVWQRVRARFYDE